MKHQTWIALPLAAALIASAYAQDSGSAASSSQNAPTAKTEQASSAEAGRQPLQAERHEGFWGKINPLARKKYVQRQMEPIRSRVNELDELTAANSKSIKDTDSRAQEGIRMASARANEADQHAIDAGNRAQAADQTAQQANTRLQTVQQAVANIDQYQAVTETEIRLRPGQSALSSKAKEALDQMAEAAKSQRGYLFEVQGFTSGKGAGAIESSQRMAESVVRYLVASHDIPVYRIYLLGRGNAPFPATAGEDKPRRVPGSLVQVSLLKNPNLEQLAAAAPVQTQGGVANGSFTQGGATGAAIQSAPQSQGTAPSGRQQPAANSGKSYTQNTQP